MPTPSARRLYKPYSGISVQIPNDGTYHQLLALILAANSGEAVRSKYLTIQSDPRRSTAYALIGEGPLDDQGATNPTVVSTTNYALALGVGNIAYYEGPGSMGGDDYVNISRFWVINDASGTGIVWLNIQALRG